MALVKMKSSKVLESLEGSLSRFVKMLDEFTDGCDQKSRNSIIEQETHRHKNKISELEIMCEISGYVYLDYKDAMLIRK